jgi:hypothetical protein
MAANPPPEYGGVRVGEVVQYEGVPHRVVELRENIDHHCDKGLGCWEHWHPVLHRLTSAEVLSLSRPPMLRLRKPVAAALAVVAFDALLLLAWTLARSR